MKKTVLLMVCATLLLGGCKKDGGANSGDQQSAQTSDELGKITWDYFLVGSWRYDESIDEKGRFTTFPMGIEQFFGNGNYINYAQTQKGEKAIVRGIWRLDEKADFTVWVTQTSVELADGTKNEGNAKRKYTILKLDPEHSLTYQTGDVTRLAEWMGR